MKIFECPLKNFENCITIGCAWFDRSNECCSILTIANKMSEIEINTTG